MYKQVKNSMTGEISTQSIEKIVDGKIWYIPCDPNNIDYQEYLEWVAIDGNNIEAPD